MIVRLPNGETKIVSNIYHSKFLKEGFDALEVQSRATSLERIPNKEAENLLEKSSSKKKGPIGSLITASSPYGGRDDSDTTNLQRKKLRELLKENPMAYSYVIDIPREAIYSPEGLRIQKQKWQPVDVGAEAVREWQHLFEARKGQASLMNLSIWAAMYYRHYGEVIGEVRTLKSDYLHLIGYPGNIMVGNINLICPALLEDVQYDHDTGELASITLPDSKGIVKTFTGADLDRFFYFHNMPDNERRGISRLTTTKRWLEGFDDLLELDMEMHYNDARPIEQHIIDEDGLGEQQKIDLREEHEETIKNTIQDRSRAMITSKRVEIKLNGYQGRALDSGPLLEKVKGYNHQSLKQPESFVEAKNANKATIDIQEKHYQTSQLEAVDRAVARELWEEHVFPRVLATRGITPLLTPIIKFPPLTSSNQFETALTWQVEGELFGQARVAQIAEEHGIDYDKVKLAVDQKRESMMKAAVDNMLKG